MKHSISPGLLPSIVYVPASKSYANRALILASLKPGDVVLSNMPKATDVTFLIAALKKIGLELTVEKNTIHISNSFPDCENNGCNIHIGEGGTTARFLACMLALGSKPYTLILGARLKERPWNEFISLIQKLGGKAKLEHDRLFIQGPINFPLNLEVDCSETTQFASGMQLICSVHKTEIIPVNMQASGSYWEMTKNLITHFKTNREFLIPLDWSSASYPMAFAALKQPMLFPGLVFDSHQADAKFLTILKTLGAITETSEGIKVTPVEAKKDFILDVSDSLDLVPTLSFFLSHIEGTHRLKGIQNLVHKESNRLEEVINLMDEFGLKSYVEKDELIIEGSNVVRGLKIELLLPNDHRMIMCAALFLRYHQGGSVSPAEAVEKSYPDFFQLFR